jgi:hypothetical protein
LLIIVTKNEWVYESFSEDEEEVDTPREKKGVVHTSSASVGEKKRGKAGAAGQKSLMSFFGKK